MATLPHVGENLGRYRIVEQIGQGGMGVVFRAFDEQLQRYVALKFMSPASDEARRKRFRTEALALARLNHPYIGVIHGFETIDGIDVLVMEYLAGQTLAERISGSPMPEAQVVSIGQQLAAALREAHASGVIHRDLKPGNIILTGDGHAKILDFGLALLQGEATDTVSRVKLEGTVQYIAPEVLRGGIPDERSDIYALGAVLYEMATGRAPHARESFAEMVDSILHQELIPPERIQPAISASLAHVIKKALEADVESRYQNAADLRADLLVMQSGTALDIPAVKPKRGRLWKRIALALLLPVIALLLLWTGSVLPGTFSEKRVIAVLPFEAISGGAENQALSRGLTDLVTVRLAQVGPQYKFEVIPASEVRTQEITSAEQAREKLGANLVVEGSWDFGGQHRILYALVDTKRHRNINATMVPVSEGDIYAAENNVLQSLLSMLDVEQGKQGAPGPMTTKPDAYQYYVRGRGYLWDYQNPESLERAISLFQLATDADTKFALAHAALGEAYWRRFEESKDSQWVKKALDACQKAAGIDHGLSPVHSTLGLIYHGTGKQQDAVTEFEQALKLDPMNDTASRGLAASYESLGDKSKAEATYRQAIALRPDYWGGYHELGVFYYRSSRLDLAAEQFKHVADMVPDNARVHSDLGGIYYLQNKYADARKEFQRSIAIQPNQRAYSNLGTLDFFDRQYAASATDFEQALKINDRDGRIWRNLGWSYYWGGQKDKAPEDFRRSVDLFEQQLKVNPNDTSAMILAADDYSMIGEKGKAESLLAKGLANSSDAESAFRGVEIYENLGKRDEALKWLGTAVQRGYVITEIERDPSLVELRKDARYAKVIQGTKP